MLTERILYQESHSGLDNALQQKIISLRGQRQDIKDTKEDIFRLKTEMSF